MIDFLDNDHNRFAEKDFTLISSRSKNARKAEIKKALETLLGYELPEEAVQRIHLLQAVAAYDRTDVNGWM